MLILILCVVGGEGLTLKQILPTASLRHILIQRLVVVPALGRVYAGRAAGLIAVAVRANPPPRNAAGIGAVSWKIC